MASIGPYIRETVIPGDLSVSEAARRLGIGRPALSNLLNGKSKLSRDLALKLEREFGADADALIRRQAQMEADSRDRAVHVSASRANAAGYFKITSTDIAHWAETTAARTILPVLCRRLAHGDTQRDAKIDFPGNDVGERHGWDGLTETDQAGHWVPQGRTGWELSASKDLPGKPNRDYKARTDLTKAERMRTTLICITAQPWPGKERWAEEKRALGEWRDVRAYDASDLEQWLEQSATTQVWFRELLGKPVENIQSIGESWETWTQSTNPPLSPLLFSDALRDHRSALQAWLAQPSEQPFVVVADSSAEALAFLALALKEANGSEGPIYESAILVTSPHALRQVAAATQDAVIVVADSATEVAASSLAHRQRIIIVRPRTSVENDPDVALDTPSDACFSAALEDMGIDEERLEQLKDESGFAPTILRRRLAKAPALRTPVWAKDEGLLRRLMPMLLAGAWTRTLEADQMLVGDLADKPFETVEADLVHLLAIEDTPVWAIGNYRGLVSRKDALFAAGKALTQEDIDRFFEVAEFVLSEDDPSLDLAPEDRWTAGMRGKKRDISGALRVGINELLVLFAVYGGQVLGPHIRPVRLRVDALISKLLRGVEARNWLSQREDLPVLAEAAPQAFLQAVEADLRATEPQIMAMLRPAGSGPFDSPDRSGLLWALETTAWDPDNYFRVGRILARLSEVPIDDNWMNKPENSLASLVRSWFPQTGAAIEQRLELIDILAREFPNVGWKICGAQVDPRGGMATANSKPRWRGVVAGAARPTDDEIYRTNRYALDKMLDWPRPDADQLADLIEVSADLPNADQARIWKRVREWIDHRPSDEDRASLREKMRRSVLSRREQKKRQSSSLEKARREIFDLLAPVDLLARHRWLFAEDWVSESGDALFDDNFDYAAHEQHIASLRQDALAEIYADGGLDNVELLLAGSNAWGTIGHFLARITADGDKADMVATMVMRLARSDNRPLTGCLRGFLVTIDDDNRPALVAGLNDSMTDEDALILFKALPFAGTTWAQIDALRPSLADRYWREVSIYGWRHSDAELNTLIDRLLNADRPFSAFNAIRLDYKRVEAASLARLLKALTRPTSEDGTQRLDAHSISEALTALDGTGEVSVADMAQLEYLFIDALSHSKHGIPNLEKQIAEIPGDFVHLVTILFNRDDRGEDPPEIRPPADADLKAIGHNVFRVLERLRRTPGSRNDGSIDSTKLLGWLVEARDRLRVVGRAEVGDSQIGQLLGRTVAGSDGIWPHEAVRDALEACGSERMMRGMEIGLLNNRGAVWRATGGAQEASLAEKYRGFAKRVQANYPVTAHLLNSIADTYSGQAEWHETDEAVRKRLRRR